jgi:hypothetical protein
MSVERLKHFCGNAATPTVFWWPVMIGDNYRRTIVLRKRLYAPPGAHIGVKQEILTIDSARSLQTEQEVFPCHEDSIVAIANKKALGINGLFMDWRKR